jgi:hypothetical protein
MKKVNAIILLELSPESVKASGSFFSELEKISGFEKGFLCIPNKNQWRNFFQGEKDETDERWDKPHAVVTFEIKSEEENEKIIEKLNNIKSCKVFKTNIEQKLKVIATWQKF